MATATAAMADEILYFTELLGLKVVDLRGKKIGNLRDAALVPLIDPLRIDRFLVGAGPGWLSVRYDQVRSIELDGIQLKDEVLTPYHSDEYMLRMGRDLLDQQIIDAQGRKVVRVNDITFLKVRHDGRDVLRVLEVDIGIRSILRRVLRGVIPPSAIRKLQAKIPPRSIRWEFCNILEPDPQRRIRLNISNSLLEKMHPADLADIVEELSPEDREALISAIDREVAAETLSEVDPEIQVSIFESLEPEKAAEIMEEMAPHEVADVLGDMPEARSEELLDEMEPQDKQEVEELLEFRDDTAGGLMNTEFIALPEAATVADAIVSLRQNEENLDNIYSVFLIDSDERLIATVPLTRLFLAAGDSGLRSLAAEPLLAVSVDERQKRVAEVFDKYNLLALPVVDDDQKLVGVISVDDVVSVLRNR
jgi:CBS domain-containing protein/sporulation protein YlmC with PRC-barrel domain